MSDKFKKSRETAGYYIRVFKDKNNLKLEVNNLQDERYKSNIIKFCKTMIDTAAVDIIKAYEPFVIDKNDYKEELQLNYVSIINVLLNQDYEFFEKYLTEMAKIFKIKQSFKYNLAYEAGEIKLNGHPIPDGLLDII